MQELMDKLQHILGTPEGQAQLNNIANMLNHNQPTQQNQAPPPPSDFQQPTNAGVGNNNTNQNSGGGFDLSALTSMLGATANSGDNPLSSLLSSLQSNGTEPSSPQSGMPNIDMNMIMNLQRVFSKMNTNDKNSQLLYALKPHFSEARQGKIDQAISMMRLMTMLPALQESGIFSGL